jgi:hypothetical protein
MDWKQFVASIAGSLAWPAVLTVLLFMLRNHLSSLVGRLEEFTLPGGAKARFVRQLETARHQAEQLPPPPGAISGMPLPPPLPPNDPFLQLASMFPEAAILRSFQDLEHTLQEIKNHFPGNAGGSFKNLVQRLLDLNYIDEKALELYLSLRAARNAAAHSGVGNRITPGEAVDFREQVKLLNDVFENALERLRRE